MPGNPLSASTWWGTNRRDSAKVLRALWANCPGEWSAKPDTRSCRSRAKLALLEQVVQDETTACAARFLSKPTWRGKRLPRNRAMPRRPETGQRQGKWSVQIKRHKVLSSLVHRKYPLTQRTNVIHEQETSLSLNYYKKLSENTFFPLCPKPCGADIWHTKMCLSLRCAYLLLPPKHFEKIS
jgi:hypothetical protein